MLDDDNEEEEEKDDDEEEEEESSTMRLLFQLLLTSLSLSVSRLPDISTSIPVFDSPALVFTRFSIILRLRPPLLSVSFRYVKLP